MKHKVTQISQAEITKMLKEHNTYPQLISKDEIASLIRLLNMKSNDVNKRDIAFLDYDQFIELIPQLAYLCFGRPPVDKSHLPAIEMMQALLSTWEQATREKGKSTVLFEDPDSSVFQDKELISALNKKIAADPDYPIPEGYRKVTERIPVYSYTIPKSIREQMREAKQIVI